VNAELFDQVTDWLAYGPLRPGTSAGHARLPLPCYPWTAETDARQASATTDPPPQTGAFAMRMLRCGTHHVSAIILTI